MDDRKHKLKSIIIIIVSIVFLYLIISLYFTHHFFFNTVINGVNVSLKSYDDAERIVSNNIKNYELHLIERNGGAETISGQDIGMHYNKNNRISDVYKLQRSLRWFGSIFMRQNYSIIDLFNYNQASLKRIIDDLNCFNGYIVEPQNVKFIYSNGSYELFLEEYGNKIKKEVLAVAVENYIRTGKTDLDLDKNNCYETPKYTFSSEKTRKTRNLLNKYVSAKIRYTFGNEMELVDGNVINEWLSVDDNLDVVINETAIFKYIDGLGKKYDTAGITRMFKASTGKTVEVKGGLYGWHINRIAETKALLENIEQGAVIEREPAYSTKAKSWNKGNDIGNTYIEINITKQHLWFYKDGALITEGAVVTGNPNRGNSTVKGAYFVVYKEKDSTLSGVNYDVKVTYWMPFFGNIGIHDASWRSSFGGEIYKRNGTHGCVNAPYYLAKTIYENIDEGVPVIVYEE